MVRIFYLSAITMALAFGIFGDERPESCAVSGRIANAATGQPIRNAQLNLRSVTTDERAFEMSISTLLSAHDEGEPVMSARVMAISKRWIAGKSHNVVVRSADTNDLGEFRLSNLAPGAYALFTQGPIEYQSLNTRQKEHFMPVFYPGVQELGQSTPIDVQANQDVAGVIVQLKKGSRFHIRGKITPIGDWDGSNVTALPD